MLWQSSCVMGPLPIHLSSSSPWMALQSQPRLLQLSTLKPMGLLFLFQAPIPSWLPPGLSLNVASSEILAPPQP
jgi:hypothetical protein